MLLADFDDVAELSLEIGLDSDVDVSGIIQSDSLNVSEFTVKGSDRF